MNDSPSMKRNRSPILGKENNTPKRTKILNSPNNQRESSPINRSPKSNNRDYSPINRSPNSNRRDYSPRNRDFYKRNNSPNNRGDYSRNRSPKSNRSDIESKLEENQLNEDSIWKQKREEQKRNREKEEDSIQQKKAQKRRELAFSSPVWSRSPSPPQFLRTLISLRKKGLEDSFSEEEEKQPKEEKKEKKDKKEKKKRKKKKKDDEWVEKKVVVPTNTINKLGPNPLPTIVSEKDDFGKSLMPGEAQAMANFVQEEKRIPRRGEIGLEAEEIEKFESLGFVMSGSRHRRMNAVRMRKESQIYSAEEKRMLSQFNFEEKAKKEQKILSDFKSLINKSKK